MTTDACLFTLEDEFPDREFDPHYLEEGRAAGVKHCARIPALFADSTVTVPEVAVWVRRLAAATVLGMRSYVPAVRSGPSLLLVGPTGTGKTHQAFGALRAIAASGLVCNWLATTAADVYAAMRPRPRVDSEREFARFAEAQLLLLDDIGVAQATPWTEEVNFRLINHRYGNRLPTIVTSNLASRAALTDRVGERVMSRLDGMCQSVVLAGEDRRRTSTTNPRSEA